MARKAPKSCKLPVLRRYSCPGGGQRPSPTPGNLDTPTPGEENLALSTAGGARLHSPNRSHKPSAATGLV